MSEDHEIEPKKAAELIESGAPAIDVRETDEYEAGHIAGARHVRLDTLTAESAGVEPGSEIVFYCRGGDRSGSAADAFEASGFDAASLAGGIVGWRDAGRRIEGEIGHPSGLPPR